MSFPEIPALNRLRDLDEVAAAFVYDKDVRVLAAAVPDHYTDIVLEQLVRRLQQITDLVDRAKVRLREMRFTFEGFSVWLKVFGQGLTLVVFIQPRAAIFPLRQPINLTVVNLEKALNQARMEGLADASESLAVMAHRAEMELIRAQTGHLDQKFLEQMKVLAEVMIGPHAQDFINLSMREMDASSTFDTRPNMEKLAGLVANHIPNVERRQFFLAEMDDIIERNELLAPDRQTGKS